MRRAGVGMGGGQGLFSFESWIICWQGEYGLCPDVSQQVHGSAKVQRKSWLGFHAGIICYLWMGLVSFHWHSYCWCCGMDVPVPWLHESCRGSLRSSLLATNHFWPAPERLLSPDSRFYKARWALWHHCLKVPARSERDVTSTKEALGWVDCVPEVPWWKQKSRNATQRKQKHTTAPGSSPIQPPLARLTIPLCCRLHGGVVAPSLALSARLPAKPAWERCSQESTWSSCIQGRAFNLLWDLHNEMKYFARYTLNWLHFLIPTPSSCYPQATATWFSPDFPAKTIPYLV